MSMLKFFRKYHKWAGVVLTVLLVLFAISGIILNHRDLLSRVSVNRNYLPGDYRYENWNIAAVRDMYGLSQDSVLLYGNVGVWLTDSTVSQFRDMNAGFPDGIDNRKIFKVLRYKQYLLAGTLFGLYGYSQNEQKWQNIALPVHEKNVVDLLVKGDSLMVMLRSGILLTTDMQNFRAMDLPTPYGYDNRVSLFKTLWVVHSGEIYGNVGKLIVDFAALIMIFLSVTGILLFFNRKKIKQRKAKAEAQKKLKQKYRWNIKWHNKVGWITIVLLLITTFTGIFLRPPLLAMIGNVRVKKIPFTELDTPNPWFDILRRMIFLPDEDMFIISTSEGFYFSGDNFKTLNRFRHQPPASVMGVTVLKNAENGALVVGSFEGLFLWDYHTGYVYDVMKQQEYIRPVKAGPPVGDFKITGYGFDKKGREIVFDYSHGATGIFGKADFPEMPAEILKKSPMSLWNVALEVHTARFYKVILGNFYILIVPLTGMFTLLILISGIVLWFKYHRKSRSAKKHIVRTE